MAYLEEKFSLSGKNALITGAAHGIGYELAKALGKAGAQVYFCVRKDLSEVTNKFTADGITATGFICDVTKESEVQSMVKQIPGGVDILVNNAGAILRKPMTETSVQEFESIIDVDLNAPFIVAKAVLPQMIEKQQGKIINICSMMSELGRETVGAYAAAKGGLKMLTKNIASEFGHYNIQCNGIGPGYIATEQTAPLRELQADGSPHPFDTFLKARTPANRWGTVDDLTGAVIYLASGASDFVNGQILYVDGGILAYIGKQP